MLINSSIGTTVYLTPIVLHPASLPQIISKVASPTIIASKGSTPNNLQASIAGSGLGLCFSVASGVIITSNKSYIPAIFNPLSAIIFLLDVTIPSLTPIPLSSWSMSFTSGNA
ncbi:hypothetical protein D3C73_955640 [compost metagenome]